MSATTAPSVTVEDVAGAGVDWLNPGNAAVSDDVYATVVLSFLTQDSDALRAIGFDFSAIPAYAIVLGVAVLIEGKASSAASLNWCELLNNGVVIGARDNSDKALTASDEVYTYGGSSSLWGGVARAHLDANFQVQTAAKATGTSTVSVDAISVVVYWRRPRGRTRAGVRSRGRAA